MSAPSPLPSNTPSTTQYLSIPSRLDQMHVLIDHRVEQDRHIFRCAMLGALAGAVSDADWELAIELAKQTLARNDEAEAVR